MDSIRADRFDCVAPSVVAQRLDKYKAALASEQSGGKHSIRSAAGPRYFFIAVVSRVLLPTRRLHLRRGGEGGCVDRADLARSSERHRHGR